MTPRHLRFLVWTPVLAVLCAPALLSFQAFIDPYSSWRHSLVVVARAAVFSLMSLGLVLAVVFGRRSVRFFALGFVLGAALENRAMEYHATHRLLRLTPGTWAPEGWYPLTVPVQRVLIERGWVSIAAPPMPAVFAGMALSGVLGGVMVLVLSHTRLRRETSSRYAESGGGSADGL